MIRDRARWLAGLVLLLVGLAGPAAAQDERPPTHHYSEDWNGIFLGAGVQGGPALLGNAALDDRLGWVVGGQLSGALILNVVSVQLDYLYSQYSASADGSPFEASFHGVGGSINFHPGFLLNMYGAGLGYIVASVYLQFGLSAEFSKINWRDRSLNESWDLGIHWGAGFDVPVTSADNDHSLWVGFNYRWNKTDLDLRVLDEAVFSDQDDLRQHLFLFRLSYRHKGLPF